MSGMGNRLIYGGHLGACFRPINVSPWRGLLVLKIRTLAHFAAHLIGSLSCHRYPLLLIWHFKYNGKSNQAILLNHTRSSVCGERRWDAKENKLYQFSWSLCFMKATLAWIMKHAWNMDPGIGSMHEVTWWCDDVLHRGRNRRKKKTRYV